MTHKYTATAFEAAAAFVADKRIDACVSWAPDIYNIPEKVPGTRILTTTAEANKLIADVWAARADFAKDHPEIIKGLVAGIFKGMEQLERPGLQGQGLPVDGRGLRHAGGRGARAWQNDAHSTNFAENKDFFLNQNDPANFERTWKNITFVYRELDLIGTPVALRRGHGLLGHQAARGRGRLQEPEGRVPDHLRADHLQQGPGRGSPSSPRPSASTSTPTRPTSTSRSTTTWAPRSPTPSTTPAWRPPWRRWRAWSGQYERAVIAVVGHADSSMKGKGTRYEDVKQLSLDRAAAVKKALVAKYKFDPNKFVGRGQGVGRARRTPTTP